MRRVGGTAPRPGPPPAGISTGCQASSMRTRSLLVVASTGQLAAGVAGQRVALRDGRPFDIALLRWRGDPRRVARDSWLFGTGLSAPVVMLAAQAALTTCLAARPSRNATLSLGALGAAMSAGYLVESLGVRCRREAGTSPSRPSPGRDSPSRWPWPCSAFAMSLTPELECTSPGTMRGSPSATVRGRRWPPTPARRENVTLFRAQMCRASVALCNN